MGMNKSVYVGPYISAKLTDEDSQAATNWWAVSSECGDEELCSGEIFVPDGLEKKKVGGLDLGEESGVFQLPPLFSKENAILQKALDKFKETDSNATLNFGVIVSWG